VPADDQIVPMELRLGIEGSAIETSGKESPTTVSVETFNRNDEYQRRAMEFPIESKPHGLLLVAGWVP